MQEAKIRLKKKFYPLVENSTRYFLITGGRGSSKSFSVNTFLCLLLIEGGHRVLFLRQTLTSAYLSIIPEFLEKIELLGLEELFEITKTEIICKSTGSAILFRGIQTGSKNNTANLKSLQGITTLVIDEAEEVYSEAIFDKIDFSVRQKGVQNRVILILNPVTKENWIYQRYFEQSGVNAGFNGVKGNVTYIHTDYRDNIKHLDNSFLEQVELLKDRNPAKYEHQILGGWLDKAEGVIFSNWMIGPFVDTGYTLYGSDFGFSLDQTTLVHIAIDKAAKKIYLKECLYKTRMTTSDIIQAYQQCGTSLIVADSAEPRLIDEVAKTGINIKGAVKGPGSITAGIALMQDYQLVVTEDSVNLIKELNNYVWNDKKSGVPVDAFNHLLDGARYGISELLQADRSVDFGW
jgi:phage terminase large subunit